MNQATASTVLLLSSVLHASWNTATKLSRDKDVFIFLTIVFSSLLVLVALLVQEREIVLGGPKGTTLAFLAGLFEGGYLISMARGFARATLAKAYSIMRGGAMVVVWIFSLGFGMEQLSGAGMLGSLLVLAGIATTGIRFGAVTATSRGEAPRSEIFWPLLGSVFIAGYHLCYGESLRLGAEPKSLFLIGLVTSMPFTYLVSRKRFAYRAIEVLRTERGKLAISTVGAGLGFLLFLYGLSHSGPGFAITLRNTSIFFSIILSVMIGDRLTRAQLLGSLIIASGAILLSVAG